MLLLRLTRIRRSNFSMQKGFAKRYKYWCHFARPRNVVSAGQILPLFGRQGKIFCRLLCYIHANTLTTLEQRFCSDFRKMIFLTDFPYFSTQLKSPSIAMSHILSRFFTVLFTVKQPKLTPILYVQSESLRDPESHKQAQTLFQTMLIRTLISQ